MEVKELQEKADTLTTELEAKNTELSEKEAERLAVVELKEKAESELKELKEQIANKAIVEFVEANSSKEAMKFLPSEKERGIRILKALDNEIICFEEGEVKLTARQEFEAFVAGIESRVDFTENTKQGDKVEDEEVVEFESEEEKRDFIANKAVELAAEKKISISEAQDELMEKYK